MDTTDQNELAVLPVLGAAGLIVGAAQLIASGFGGAGFALGGAALLPPAIMALGCHLYLRANRCDAGGANGRAAAAPAGSQPLFDEPAPAESGAPASWRRWFHIALPLALAAAGMLGAMRVSWIAALPAGAAAAGYFPPTALAVEFLLLLALSRYFRLRADMPDGRQLLRPLAALCEWAGCLALAGAGAEALRPLEWWWPERLVGWGGAFLLALVAIEYFFRALARGAGADVSDLARHLDCGAAHLPAFSGRGGHLLGDTLDYQFGCAFSRTWVYRFVARAMIPFVALSVLILHAMSAMVIIAPDELGVLERWGAPRASGWRLESGLRWKLPWPIETVRRFPARRMQSLAVGYRPDTAAPSVRPALWDMPRHSIPAYFITPSRAVMSTIVNPGDAGRPARGVPANLLVMNVTVEFIVTNLLQYAYGFENPRAALEQSALRALTRRAAGMDMFEILTVGRAALADDWRRDIQADADAQKLGVAIIFIAAHEIQPPPQLAPDFHAVAAAGIEQRTLALGAQTWAARQLPLAAAQAESRIAAAESYRRRRAAMAAAEAGRFAAQTAGYDASPRVFRARRALRALAQGLAKARKYVIAGAAAREVLLLNLEEKIKPDLWDLSAPAQPTEQATP